MPLGVLLVELLRAGGRTVAGDRFPRGRRDRGERDSGDRALHRVGLRARPTGTRGSSRGPERGTPPDDPGRQRDGGARPIRARLPRLGAGRGPCPHDATREQRRHAAESRRVGLDHVPRHRIHIRNLAPGPQRRSALPRGLRLDHPDPPSAKGRSSHAAPAAGRVVAARDRTMNARTLAFVWATMGLILVSGSAASNARAASPPTLSIVSPANNAVIGNGSSVAVVFVASNFNLTAPGTNPPSPNAGHVEVSVDGRLTSHVSMNAFRLSLASGPHTILLRLVMDNGTGRTPDVAEFVSVA